ncbi:hypothetical protein TNCV_4979181 [Trichonephila clavipes]|nr:hypothetical protein TNCV_4979181 [Trichonephila clavipes]
MDRTPETTADITNVQLYSTDLRELGVTQFSNLDGLSFFSPISETRVKSVPEPNEIDNVVRGIVRQLNLEMDSDDVQEMLDSQTEELTTDELLKMLEQDIEELVFRARSFRRSNDGWEFTEGLS